MARINHSAVERLPAVGRLRNHEQGMALQEYAASVCHGDGHGLVGQALMWGAQCPSDIHLGKLPGREFASTSIDVLPYDHPLLLPCR
jgi:hypothetical protein